MATVAIASFTAFLGAIGAKFVWDDHFIVEANHDIESFAAVLTTFSSHALSGAGEILRGEHAVQYYRPTWIVLLGLEHAVWGGSPHGYHLTSVLLHTMTSIAVLLLCRELFQDAWAALVAGLVFAVHPVHVEAVAWISASNELCAGLFGVLFFWAYVRTRRCGGASNAIACILSLICALLSKESAVMLPLLAALWEVAQGTGTALARIRWTIALGVIAVMYVALRAQIVAPHPDPHPFVWRLLTSPRLLMEYLGLLCLPIRMRVYHDVQFIRTVGDIAFIMPMLGLVVWLSAALFCRRRAPLVFFGLGWIALALLPVSGLAAVPQPAPLAERFLYTPSAGLAIVAGALCLFGFGATSAVTRRATMGAVGVVLAGLSSVTVRQVGVWHDDVSLMSRMVVDAPGAPTGHANLGAALERLGRLEVATREYRVAVRMEPNDHMMHRNLGVALVKQNLNQEAESELHAALTLKPDYTEARGDLGWLYSREARWGDAQREYALAIQAQPSKVEDRIGLADALLNLGRLDEAERAIDSVIALYPNNAQAHLTKSAVADRFGRHSESEREAAVARQLLPASADAHYNAGVALSLQGRTDAAALEFEMAIALQPRWAKAHFNLGVMRARQLRRVEALAELDRAIEFAAPDTALAGRARAARRMVATSK